jgi:hypothetical protein
MDGLLGDGMSKVVEFKGWSAEDRLRDELMTARAILRNAVDGPVSDDLLRLVEDIADDLKKAINNYRGGVWS